MSLSLSYIRWIAQISRNPVIGLFIFLGFYLYNKIADISLFFTKYLQPSRCHHSAIIHSTSLMSLWGVKVASKAIIGERTIIKARTDIGEGVSIGDRSIIGDTGFQVFKYGRWRLPVVHTGKVQIGDLVVIGSRTSIDRALFGKTTTIHSGSIVGSNVKIGHNIIIGKYCRIGDGVAIGGNSTIGDRVIIGEQVAISNRISIASDSVIPPGSIVTRDIQPKESP